jgi:hypothetical protein
MRRGEDVARRGRGGRGMFGGHCQQNVRHRPGLLGLTQRRQGAKAQGTDFGILPPTGWARKITIRRSDDPGRLANDWGILGDDLGRLPSPAGRRASPAGRLTNDLGRTPSPAGRLPSPAGWLASPAGTLASDLGCMPDDARILANNLIFSSGNLGIPA